MEKKEVPFKEYFVQAGDETNIPWQLLAAICKEESNFQPDAVSGIGAYGLMQLTPQAAETVGYTEVPKDPANNIMCGAKFVRWLLDYLAPPKVEKVTGALVSYVWGVGNYLMTTNPPDWPDEVLTYILRVYDDYFNYADN